jgi:DNA-binding IscR family transcriptional regulator
MQVSSKFTIAVHTLLCIKKFSSEYKVTSDFIAGSVGVNPVIIRRTLQALKRAGMIKVTTGTGGAEIAADPAVITLYDIYIASGSADVSVFHFHEQPNPKCPVGKNIHKVLDSHLNDAQKAFENNLKKVKLSDLIHDLNKQIKNSQ